MGVRMATFHTLGLRLPSSRARSARGSWSLATLAASSTRFSIRTSRNVHLRFMLPLAQTLGPSASMKRRKAALSAALWLAKATRTAGIGSTTCTRFCTWTRITVAAEAAGKGGPPNARLQSARLTVHLAVSVSAS